MSDKVDLSSKPTCELVYMLSMGIKSMRELSDPFYFTAMLYNIDEIHSELIRREVYFHMMSEEDVESEIVEFFMLEKEV